MSQENVDRFKEGIERFNHGDLAGVLRYYHPEIQFEHRLVELQVDVTGIDAVRDWHRGCHSGIRPLDSRLRRHP